MADNLNDIDMHGMFEAKMGFSAGDVPLDDEQLQRFLMLCHQAYLKNEGLMEEEGYEEGEEVEEESYDEGPGNGKKMKVKVIKVQDGDVHGMMNQLLGPMMHGGY